MDKYFKKRTVKTMLDFLGSIIAYPFRWIDSISPNYVVTLILFAILMKLVLFPFGIKQQKNSVKQEKLRPYETIIRKKYAGRTDNVSKQKMNQEIMDLYQKENFNPASGCLPLLLQLPILFALYQVIIKPATFLLQFPKDVLTKIGEIAELVVGEKVITEIDQINKILGADLTVLEADVATQVKALMSSVVTVKGDATTVGAALENLKDSFEILNLNLMDKPEFALTPLVLIPIFVFVFSWGSMKLTRKFTYQPQAGDNATAASMKMMDITMPLMSTFICFGVPAGIGIYWIIQNVLGVVQQFVLFKLYPIPPMTEEELKQAELQMRGRAKREQKAEKKTPEIFEPAPLKSAGGKKKALTQSKPKISAHGKARIKNHGTVPVAVRRPGASKR